MALDDVISYALTVSESSSKLYLPPPLRYPWNLCGGVVTNLAGFEALTDLFYLMGDFVYASVLVKMTLTRFYTYGYTGMALVVSACIIGMWAFPNLLFIYSMLFMALSSVTIYLAMDYGYYGFSAHSTARSFGFALQIYHTSTIIIELFVGVLMIMQLKELILFLCIFALIILSILYGFLIAFIILPKYQTLQVEVVEENESKDIQNNDDNAVAAYLHPEVP